MDNLSDIEATDTLEEARAKYNRNFQILKNALEELATEIAEIKNGK